VKNFLFLLLILLAFNSSSQEPGMFTDEELNWIKEHPVVTYSYDPKWKPIGFKNDFGQYDGMSKDILKIIVQKSGLEVRINPDANSWEETLNLLKEGKIDFTPSLAMTSERIKDMDFSTTYMSYRFVLVNREKGEFVGELADLKGKVVAVPTKYYITSFLEEIYPDYTYKYYSGLEECLEAVSSGEADATVGNIAVISYYLNYDQYDNLKIAAPLDDLKINVKLGFSKGNRILVSIFDKCLASISDDEMRKIKQNWVAAKYGSSFNMNKVWPILSTVLIMSLLFLLIYYRLNKKLRNEIQLRELVQKKLDESLK